MQNEPCPCGKRRGKIGGKPSRSVLRPPKSQHVDNRISMRPNSIAIWTVGALMVLAALTGIVKAFLPLFL